MMKWSTALALLGLFVVHCKGESTFVTKNQPISAYLACNWAFEFCLCVIKVGCQIASTINSHFFSYLPKGACTTPKTFQTYSSSDILMSSEAIFIVEFEMTCDASEVRGGGDPRRREKNGCCSHFMASACPRER